VADEAEAHARVQALRVSSVMTRPTQALDESATLAEAATRFLDYRIGALPVLDGDGHVVGIVSYTDVVRELLRHPVRVKRKVAWRSRMHARACVRPRRGPLARLLQLRARRR